MRGIIFVLSFLLAFDLVLGLRKPVCRILALEGGGTKGAFQAGAFRAMVEFLNPDDIKYDVIAGASVGSLNGILFASTEIGKEKELSKRLGEFWSTIKSDDVLVNWPYFGIIRGFFDKTSFFDNSPLLKYVTKQFANFGNKIRRKYTITAVNINTAETIRATENVGNEDIPKYVVASAAVPGFFPYSQINGKPYIDGGTVDNTNVRGGIERCREIVGDDDSAIIVDVMMTNTVTKYAWMDMSKAKSYTLYSRGNEISEKHKTYFYLMDAIAAFPEVNWRYLILPKESLPNYPVIALSFDRATLKKAEQIGYDITKEMIKTGEPNFKNMLGELRSASRDRIRLP